MPRPLLVFDVSPLSGGVAGTGDRGGIFWVTFNLLKQFAVDGRFETSLYCEPEGIYNAQKFLEQNFPAALKLEFINKTQDNFFARRQTYYKTRKNFYGHTKKPLKKLLCDCAGGICKVLCVLVAARRAGWKKRAAETDLFFSSGRAAAPAFARNKKIKKFTMLYDTIPFSCPGLYKNKNKKFLRLVRSLNKNDFYFADSDSARFDFLKYAPAIDPKKIKTALLASNMPYVKITDGEVISRVKEKYKIPPDKKYILSVSTLDPRKNMMFAVTGFLNFIKKNNIKDLVFVLAGAHYESFAARIKNLPSALRGLEDRIITAGYVDDVDMNAIYSGAEIFVFPSLYEGFGMPILEAMQSGVPVICSNTSSMPEVIGDAGIMIDPQKEEALVAALEKIYFNGDLGKILSEKGLERAKQFTWEKTAAVILDGMSGVI